jgi:hypothetical protein
MADVGDHAAHLEALHDASGGTVTIWLTDTDGTPVVPDEDPVLNFVTDDGSVKIVGVAADGGWRFAHEALAGHPERARFRLGIGGKSYTTDLPDAHAAHAETHGPNGPHEGTVAPFHGPDGTTVGHLELKLHDDKGDLELWLATDEEIETPYDLPLDATIEVTLVDEGNRSVTLRVRNAEANEDEDGTPNIRDGKTNYFIFPGDTGADASWLMGASFASDATVVFTADGVRHETEPFMLRPHTHAHGHEHDHEGDCVCEACAHEDCGHAHADDDCGHDHGHDEDPGHDHDHDHDHED